jgi:hypothetical protein
MHSSWSRSAVLAIELRLFLKVLCLLGTMKYMAATGGAAMAPVPWLPPAVVLLAQHNLVAAPGALLLALRAQLGKTTSRSFYEAVVAEAESLANALATFDSAVPTPRNWAPTPSHDCLVCVFCLFVFHMFSITPENIVVTSIRTSS